MAAGWIWTLLSRIASFLLTALVLLQALYEVIMIPHGFYEVGQTPEIFVCCLLSPSIHPLENRVCKIRELSCLGPTK